MADVDVLIRPPDHGAPLNYAVSNVAEIVPKSVRAVFDGSGAGAPFVCELAIISPQGHVIAKSTTDTVVPAGGSADVSWFPGVKEAAAVAAAAGIESCIASSALPYNIPPTGGALNAATTWASVIPASGTFKWPSSASTAKIGVTKQGLYLCLYCPTPVAVWPAPLAGFVEFSAQSVGAGTGFLHETFFLNTTTSALFAGLAQRPLIGAMAINLPAADEIQLFAANSTVGNFAMQITNLLIVRLGDHIPGAVI